MLMLYKYEGKTKEEALLKCITDLKENESELYIRQLEEPQKLFKSKKYLIEAIKKYDVKEYIKKYISDISKHMNIEIKSEIREKDEIIYVTLISDNNSILIGKDGRTLKSLQILLRQSLINNTGFNIKVNIDASNYKYKKEKNLKYTIKTIAKEVLNTKMDVKLDPMNSYERRIVHNIISEYENLETESIGVEPERYVLIKYKEN